MAGGFGLPELLPLSGRIEESFLRRLEELPDETRLLLLVAAAEPVGDPALMWRAATRLGVAATALDPAARTDLLDVRAQVRFRHPLVRSAVYRSASDSERQSVHDALAEVTDGALEPDRRVWHLAQAAYGPDEDVAAELERSAGRAQARGGLAAAAAFLARAADLTVEPSRRAERMLAATQANLQAGAFDSALGLLAAAEAGPLDELGAHARSFYAPRSRLHRTAGTMLRRCCCGRHGRSRRSTPDSRATPISTLGARRCSPDSSHAPATWPTCPRLSGPLQSAESPRASDLLLDGFALVFTDGRSAATPVLRRAAHAFAGDEVAVEEVLRWGWLATAAAVFVWDYDTCLAVSTRGVQLARDAGALEVLPVGVNVLAQAAALGGDFGTAALLIAEANAVTEATGTRVAPYGALVLGAFRGEEAEAAKLIDATIEEATAGGQGTAVQYAHWARAVVMNGLGRYEEALAAATAASDDTPELFVAAWSLSELIEAATRTGEIELAARALAELVEQTQADNSDWALGIRARSRALVREGKAAEPLYREAIDRLSRTRLRPELARSRLLYGEWLRRANRRSDAREQLRAAHDAFVSMGADAFAERARHELLATGAKVRKRVDETRDELTPQEEHIARLARDGMTNPQIGAELYLSPRTVEWHLNKVFTKLGIRSRRELANALPASESDLIPA